MMRRKSKETKDVVEELKLEVKYAKDALDAITFENNFNETTLNGVIQILSHQKMFKVYQNIFLIRLST